MRPLAAEHHDGQNGVDARSVDELTAVGAPRHTLDDLTKPARSPTASRRPGLADPPRRAQARTRDRHRDAIRVTLIRHPATPPTARCVGIARRSTC